LTRIRTEESIFDPKWIAFVLHFLFIKGVYKMNRTQYVNQASIGKTFLQTKIFIPIPSLNEQHRIIAKIEESFFNLEKSKQEFEKVKIQLKNFRKSLLKYAFKGEFTKTWRDKNEKKLESADSILEKIKIKKPDKFGRKSSKTDLDLTQLSKIPKLWKWSKLEDIAGKITDGTHHTPTYVSNGIPFLSVKDISDGIPKFDDCKYISEKEHDALISRCNPEFNDILITKSGTIGRIAIINTNKKFSLFVSVALIKPQKEYINPEYLAYALENHINHLDLKQSIKGGVIKNFHLEDLRIVPIPLVPLLEQQVLVDKLKDNVSKILKFEKTVTEIEKNLVLFRTSILKSAFEGNLVPQDPNDEPASVLIEQFKKKKKKLVS